MNGQKAARYIGMRILFFLICIFFLFSCKEIETPKSKTNEHRIVVTYRPAAHIVSALKMEKYLVGIHNKATAVPLFQNLREDLHRIPVVGDKVGINLESILKLDPTLVILYPGNTGLQTQKRLEELGIKSEIVQVESIQEIQNSLNKVAKYLGAEKNAQNTIQEMERICRLLQDCTSGMEDSTRNSVYISSSVNFFTTHSHEMLQHEMILKAGLRDASSISYGGWVNVSVEQLMLWNPDIIVISGSAPFTVESILNNPRLAGLKAVQSQKVYRMPESRICVWDFPGPDVVLGMLWLSRLAYPEKFQNISWEKELENYYQKVYNVSYEKITKKLNGKPICKE